MSLFKSKIRFLFSTMHLAFILGLSLVLFSCATSSDSSLAYRFYSSETGRRLIQKVPKQAPYYLSIGLNLSYDSGDEDFRKKVVLGLRKLAEKELRKFGIKSKDIGKRIDFYMLDPNGRKTISIIELSSKDFKLPPDINNDPNLVEESIKVSIKDGYLFVSKGNPDPIHENSIFELRNTAGVNTSIINLKAEIDRILTDSNTDLNLLLDESKNYLGINKENSTEIASIKPFINYMDSWMKMVCNIKTIELTIDMNESDLRAFLKIEPKPSNPFAELVKKQSMKNLTRLELMPEQPGLVFFSAIDPEELGDWKNELLKFGLNEFSFSKLEEQYINEMRKKIDVLTGDFVTFSISRHPNVGPTGIFFIESYHADELLWDWINLKKVLLTRMAAHQKENRRSYMYQTASFSPNRFDRVIESQFGFPEGSILEKTPILDNEQVYYLSLNPRYAGFKSPGLTIGTIPEGVLTILNKDSVDTLDMFKDGLRYGGAKPFLKEALPNKGALLGIFIDLKRMSELNDDLKPFIPFIWLLSYDKPQILLPVFLTEELFSEGNTNWESSDKFSLVAWCEPGCLKAEIKCTSKLIDVIQKITTDKKGW